MAESLVVDWLNENEQRAFPLKETANRISGLFTLPDNVIVDALLVYTSDPGTVTLDSVVTTTLDATFNVSGGLSFVVDFSLSFPQYVRLAGGSLLVVTDKVLDIDQNQTYTFTNAYFEDSVVYEFNDPWAGVNSIKFGPDTLTGDVNLVQGLQFEVDADEEANTLILGTSRNLGLPLDCTVYGDLPNDCETVVSYVNGVIPNDASQLLFKAGANMIVLDDPTNHRIFIGVTFDDNDICRTIFPNPIDISTAVV